VLAVGARIFHAPTRNEIRTLTRMIVWWTSLAIEKQIFYAIGIGAQRGPRFANLSGQASARGWRIAKHNTSAAASEE